MSVSEVKGWWVKFGVWVGGLQLQQQSPESKCDAVIEPSVLTQIRQSYSRAAASSHLQVSPLRNRLSGRGRSRTASWSSLSVSGQRRPGSCHWLKGTLAVVRKWKETVNHTQMISSSDLRASLYVSHVDAHQHAASLCQRGKNQETSEDRASNSLWSSTPGRPAVQLYSTSGAVAGVGPAVFWWRAAGGKVNIPAAD